MHAGRGGVASAAGCHAAGEPSPIELRTPFTSAIMQAVSSPELAIALAREGGLGFLHHNRPVDDPVAGTSTRNGTTRGAGQYPHGARRKSRTAVTTSRCPRRTHGCGTSVWTVCQRPTRPGACVTSCSVRTTPTTSAFPARWWTAADGCASVRAGRSADLGEEALSRRARRRRQRRRRAGVHLPCRCGSRFHQGRCRRRLDLHHARPEGHRARTGQRRPGRRRRP